MDIPPSPSYQDSFNNIWAIRCPDIPLDRNKVVVPGTRYRFDFVHHASKTVIEVCPNPWGSKEYNKRKYYKYFMAIMYDWQVLMLGESMINRDVVRQIKRLIETRTNERTRTTDS